MSRKLADTSSRTSRSNSAERAYRAGQVTNTIYLSTPASTTVGERTVNRAARNALTLGIVAGSIWLYDIVRVVHS